MVKLSPLAHQANAHEDSVWSVAWTAGNDNLLLTGSVDECVKSWRASGDGLEMVHSYTGACGKKKNPIPLSSPCTKFFFFFSRPLISSSSSRLNPLSPSLPLR